MSLLGFDAIGRWALGQQNTSSIVLTGVTGAFALTGHAATFATKEAAAGTSYAETGNAATFRVQLSSGATSYTVTGNAANVTILEAESAAGYIVTGNAATLTRDFVNWLPSSDLAAPLWSASSGPSSIWTPATPISPNWTPEFTVPT